ncbi:MAG: hypothetical protein J5787_04205 [Alphaproteobacteria bacterium]|nr:hypothetical protein [Alphaproteobacteria bacterium]MBO4644774.1 hypothetical protein [Alphaproteobacteria bacterium]
MPVKKYDVIFSLGAACLCSQMLRKKNLQFCSYPFDWIAGGDFAFRIDLLVSGFKDFFNKEDLAFTGEQNGSETHPCEICLNKRTEMKFPHDFPTGVDFETAWPEANEKYARRIKRLINDIENGKDILIVYVMPPKEAVDSDAVLRECHDKIVRRFPDKNVDILYISCAEKYSETNIGEHVRKIAFDFDRPDGVPPYDVRKLRTAVNNYRLRQTLSDRIRNFKFKMKKRIGRWKKKASRYLTFRPSL